MELMNQKKSPKSTNLFAGFGPPSIPMRTLFTRQRSNEQDITYMYFFRMDMKVV